MLMCHQTFKSIFLSDIHIGSKDAKLDKLFDFLSSVKTNNIFLIGNIIDRHIDNNNIESHLQIQTKQTTKLLS